VRLHAIELADNANELLSEARKKAEIGYAKMTEGYTALELVQERNARREHPTLIAIATAKAQKLIAEGQREYAEATADIADAMRYIGDISRMLDRTIPKRS
jgi:hypothetical protein